MEETDFPPQRFELVVSSLAFHYVRDYRGLVGRIVCWLAPGGFLVFSTEHPIYTARAPDSELDSESDGGKVEDGWLVDGDGRRLAWALDRYSEEGPRERRRFVPGVVRYHRPLATLLNGLLDAGLTLERMVEPVPAPDWVRERPYVRTSLRRPDSSSSAPARRDRALLRAAPRSRSTARGGAAANTPRRKADRKTERGSRRTRYGCR